MLLDDEAVALALDLAATRLLGLREVALAVVGLNVELAARHGSAPASARRPLWRRLLGRSPGGRLGGRLASRRLGFWLVVAQALLQRGHQVNHVAALGRPIRLIVLDDALALLLLLLGDQLLQRIDVPVLELLGVELAALLL